METTETPPDLPPATIEFAVAASDWVIVLPVVLGLMGAALLLVLRDNRGIQPVMAVLVVIAIGLCNLELFGRVMRDGPVSMTMGAWLPPFGVAFTADVLGAGLALAASIVTLVVLVYVRVDIDPLRVRHGFYPLVLMLLAGVCGALLTGDLFNLYVWIEVLLVASIGLVAMGGRPVQLDGAFKYGILAAIASGLLLLALGLVYGLFGTLDMADIARRADQAPAGPLAGICALLLLAFGVKAAAFPVNAWLPAAVHTPPAAVSALLAGLLTTVGAYALLRVLVVLMPAARDLLDPVIAAAAVLTLVLAPLGAIAQTNLRRALGFLVIGGVGAILAGLAMPSLRGVAGGAVHAVHATLTMAALYLVAGLVERMTGTADTREMGGVYAAGSVLSLLFLVLVLAIAGLPPFLGFWPKLLLVEAGVAGGAWPLVAALLVNALLTLIAGMRLWAHVFWRAGREGALSEQPNDRLRPLTRGETLAGLLPTAALVAVVVAIGLLPEPMFEAGRIAAGDMLQAERYIAAAAGPEAGE